MRIERPVGEPYLVLELCYRKEPTDRQLCVVASIAGRMDPQIRRWRLQGYLPDAAQVSDLAAFLADLATNTTIMWLGAQEQLPLG